MWSLLFVLVIVILVVALKSAKDSPDLEVKKELPPYKKRQYLLNIPERRLFEFLNTCIPSQYIIFPQVKLNSVAIPDVERKDFRAYQSRINRKTLDLVIFKKEYLEPVLAIEYDGSTHNRTDRIERDEFVNDVLEAAGIKILHVHHERDLNFEKVGQKVLEMLK